MEQTEQALTKAEIKSIDGIVTDLLKRLGIDGDFELTESDGILEVLLKTEETGIVIGYHGEVLDSLQLVLSLMISQKLGRFQRITLEVGDYKKNRGEYLEKLAQQVKEKVITEGREHAVSSLRPWERRIMHMLLKDDADVTSESVGEGKDRVLIIKPRTA
jgi:spoIIIJ-associated protein